MSSAGPFIAEMRIGNRVKNCLLNAGGFNKVDELTRVTADELLRLPNFWNKSLQEVRAALKDLGLALLGDAGNTDYDRIISQQRAMIERQTQEIRQLRWRVKAREERRP